jgi:hypothetical protein
VSITIESVDVEALQPHPDNPRQGMLPELIEAIRTNGWHGVIVAQKSTNYILAGNHRWKAAKALNMSKVPVHWVDVDAHTARKILLSDNRLSDIAGYDDVKLSSVLEMIIFEEDAPTEKALEGTGYTVEEVTQLKMALEGGEAREWGSEGTADDARERYEETAIRQVVLVMSEEEYNRVIPRFQAMMEKHNLDTIADCVFMLLERYGPKEETDAAD